jgi:hypothetical protein
MQQEVQFDGKWWLPHHNPPNQYFGGLYSFNQSEGGVLNLKGFFRGDNEEINSNLKSF